MKPVKGSVLEWKKRASRLSVSLILLAVLGSTVWAGTNVWTSLGPEGANISSLTIDPQNPATLYAGTNGAVFRSTDGGKTWLRSNPSYAAANIHALVLDPKNAGTLYAGTSSGVFKGTEAGTTWTLLNSGLPYPTVKAVAIDPQTPETLYAGTWGDGVFKSTDAGKSWRAANSGLEIGVHLRAGNRPEKPRNVVGRYR